MQENFKNTIYLDNAATTRTRQEVVDSMMPYFTELYGNPSSIYQFAGKSRIAVENARGTIARFIGAEPKEIYFTAGGSESDNWALKASAFALREKGKHIITTKIEHHAVLHTCEYLEKLGFEITYLDVDPEGMVNPEDVEKAIRPDTILISVMFANNEIGTIEPIGQIGEIAKNHKVLFHTDAVQAFGHEKIDVNELHIDMLSASGHKFGGPKGVGIFYLRSGIRIGNLIHGGAQERGLRAGTHNVPGIVGMEKAVKLAEAEWETDREKETKLRDYLIERVLKEIPYTRLNGHRTKRLANNANFCFRYIEGESLLIMLDQEGICASSGSACTSGSLDPSHVLLAIGLPHEIAHGSLRISLFAETTAKEIDYTVDKLKLIVQRLRDMSPLYEDMLVKKGENNE